MRRTFLILLLVLLCCTLGAFDLVVPSSSDGFYLLLEGAEDFTVDDTVFYKTVLPSRIHVERYSDGITTLSSAAGDVIVLLNADSSELESNLFSLEYSTEDPVLVALYSPVDPDALDELGVSELFCAGNLPSRTRALLRRSGLPFTEAGEGDIISFTEKGAELISGDAEESMIYVRCPGCGTMIAVPLP